MSGNLMSLGALDFGLIIDGGIVVIENITRRISETKAHGLAVKGAIREATVQVVRPVLFGTAIIMIVYVPILSLQGVEGKMFVPMAIAVLSALGAALVLALTFVPAASTWIYRKGLSEKEPYLAKWARRLYEPLLGKALRYRKAVVGVALSVVVVGAAIAATMGAEFIPRLDEGAIALQTVRPPSVSLEESVRANERVESTLKAAFPDEVDTVISRTGRAEVATDPMGVEVSDVFVMLHPIESWMRAETKEQLVSAMERTLTEEVPGQNYSFSQPIELRTNELISGVRSDVAVNLYGSDFDELAAIGERIMRVLRQVDGAADVTSDQVAGLPSLRVVVDRKAAARYGINASEILDTVAAIGGRSTGTIFEGQERYTLQVRMKEEARSSPEKIGQLLVTAPNGGRIPLLQVAQVLKDEGPAVVSRENAQRRRTIQLNVRGRDLAGFVADAQKQVKEKAGVPSRVFRHLGRTVRESGKGEFATGHCGTGGIGPDSAAALHNLWLSAPGPDHLLEHSYGRGGRSGGAVAPGHAILHFGGGRIHCSFRDCGDEWSGHDFLHSGPSKRRSWVCSMPRRRAQSCASGQY